VAHIRKMVRRNTGSLSNLNHNKNDTLITQPISS
jgi:hypothetical protein